jgi:zinc-ribbon domain
MVSCKDCGTEIESVYRFCPWCGRTQRVKVTEFFFGHAAIEGDARRALRVSRYLGDETDERHVRFSVWSESELGKTRVEAAVSLDEGEAERVARFLATEETLVG